VETDRQTHTPTHKPSTVTLAAHARRGLTTLVFLQWVTCCSRLVHM